METDMRDLLLHNGTIFDGSSNEPIVADILLRQGRIASVGAIAPEPSMDVRNVSGKIVCPGFVDVHTHSDLTLVSNPLAHSTVRQGITTVVVGNCGFGFTPKPPTPVREEVRRLMTSIDLDPAVTWSWNHIGEYFLEIDAVGPSVNVAALTGHLLLRACVGGLREVGIDSAACRRLRSLLVEEMAMGSLGVSTGVMYAPMSSASETEMQDIGAVIAAYDGVFAWHVRDYGDGLVNSVRQALTVAKRTGCRTQISHLSALGARNWPSVDRVLEEVDSLNGSGCRIGVDIYPYLHGYAELFQFLPSWVQEGGPERMRRRLSEPRVVEQLREEWSSAPWKWDDLVLNWVPPGHRMEVCIGESITTLARAAGTSPEDAAIGLLVELGPSVMVIAGGRDEHNLRTVLSHPASVVASDGFSIDPLGPTGLGQPHPRSYGCFPRFLARYADGSDLGFAAAVEKCTSAPARFFGLEGRGVLKEGAAADVVVICRENLSDRATFEHPHEFPSGIDLVIVNGEVVVEASAHTGRGPGKTLLHETPKA